ncbi:MAG: SBBP repeat-containing protein [Chitinophagaceae bacterium]
MKTKNTILIVLLLPVLNAMAQGPGYVWAKQMGGVSDEYGFSVTVDAAGNVYTTGKFSGTVDFDPNAGVVDLTAEGSSDIFITKFNSAGNLLWTKQMGGGSFFNDQGNSIVVDAAGNVYTAGFFFETADFDPGPATYNLSAGAISPAYYADIFISKLDANGNFIWAKQFTGIDDKTAYSLALDGSNNIYITGYFGGTVDFDPGVATDNLTAAGGLDMYVAKLDVDGNFIWAKQFGNALDEIGQDLSVDAAGNVYITGSYDAATFFGYPTDADISILKLDNTGAVVWQQYVAEAGNNINTGYSIVINAGNVYITGTFAGDVVFPIGAGNTTLSSGDPANQDIFIVKLNDATGDFVWVKQMGGVGYDEGNSIALDAAGKLYVTGDFSSSADFDPSGGAAIHTSAGSQDIFLAKLDADGNFIWAENFGGPGYDVPYYLTLDAGYNIYSTGTFSGNGANFNPDVFAGWNTTGGQDIYVQKLNQPLLLPVTLLQFTAIPLNNSKVQLKWATVSEQNTASFLIEHSSDGIHYMSIGTVAAAGNSSTTLQYNFTDNNPLAGANFYRLKVVDIDGTFSYSEIRVLNFNGTKTILIYPNPARERLTITGAETGMELRLLNAAGQELSSFIITGNTIQLDISKLRTGCYIVQAVEDNRVVNTIKIVKQ